MAYEAVSHGSFEADASVAFQVADKLRPHLANLMGIGGFRALLARALVLANVEASWLREVQVKADGALEGLDRTRFQLDQAEFLDGTGIVLDKLLGLLVDFIGLTLTLQQLHEIWPEFTPGTWIMAGEEVQSEKTN